MRMKITTFGAALLGLIQPHRALSQQTGRFSDEGIATRSATARAPATSTRALIFDPSATSSLRASGWTFVIAHEEKNEARIQANLCDLVSACGDHNGWDLTLAGPIDTTAKFTELGDLNGLIGKARVESGYGYNVGKDSGLTLDVRATYAKFRSEYHVASSLSRETFDRNATALGVGIGYKYSPLPKNDATSALSFLTKLSYRLESSFKESDPRHLCAPSSTGPAGTLECGDFVVGEPTSDRRNVVAFEQWVSVAGVAGIRLRISRDVDNSVTGFDAPIYVLPDGKGGIGGGVRIGYRSDDKKPRFSVFVGALKF
jgi:hypothetical protein